MIRSGILVAVGMVFVLAWSPPIVTAEDDLGTARGPRTVNVALDDYSVAYYVSASAGSDTSGDGSQASPWRSLEHAMTHIQDVTPGRRVAVLVSEGAYLDETLNMKSHIDLYGGFAPHTWKRDIYGHPTILSGAGARRVLVGVNEARLDGFVVRDGSVRGKGAGLLCRGVSPVISNNVFIANKTLGPDPWQPKYWHELANDGGAIMCINRASPIIENNLFVNNRTENGRGAGLACHDRSSPRVVGNVFLNNQAGLQDPMRSSDGGALSIFGWCKPIVENNVFLGNRAMGRNDGGGVFVALWSSARILRNVFVDNSCTDDAGALFVGGQEHRYDAPLDPLPAAKDFFVEIRDNVFLGNANPSKNSGAMRFTMESRGRFVNNIVAHNSGIYFQRSEVQVINNTILDDFLFVETKEGLQPGVIVNNIIWGEFDLQTNATVSHCNIFEGYEGPGNFEAQPLFENDWVSLHAESSSYSRSRATTTIFVSAENIESNTLVNRAVKYGDKWSVIKSNTARSVTLWGDLSGAVELTVLPSYHLHADSPGIDAGMISSTVPVEDIEGESRPWGDGVDVGADEFVKRH